MQRPTRGHRSWWSRAGPRSSSLSGDTLPDQVKGPCIVHPANALPPDSVLVVRTNALDEFRARLLAREKPPSKVGGPGLAAWLKTQMQQDAMTLNYLHKCTDLDRKTIKLGFPFCLRRMAPLYTRSPPIAQKLRSSHNRCTAPGSLDTHLCYAAWRSSYSSRASIGV